MINFIDLCRKICHLRNGIGVGKIPKGQIAIARDFAIVLNEYGYLTLLGHNENFHQLYPTGRIVKVAAAFAGYMGLTERGTIITCGKADEFERPYEIECLRNVIDVTASEGHTVAIINDGTVKCIDEPGGWEGVPNHSDVVRYWTDIKQVAVGFDDIMGLTNDGHVLYHSEDGAIDVHFYDRFSDVVQIDCCSSYYGNSYSMVLHKDGTVSSESFKGIGSWRNIVQISVGEGIAIGLKKDGTIKVVGHRGTRLKAKDWKNIACIECKYFRVVGIRKDGEILSSIIP